MHIDANADYFAFLSRKQVEALPTGIENVPALNPAMFPYQRDVTEFLLRVGRGGAFLDTGLGKSIVSLDWGRVVAEHTTKPVLMLAPLAVAPQHVREAAKFSIDARVVRHQDQVKPGLNVANYEVLHHFQPDGFGGVVLDESSIIKSFTGKTTRSLMAFASAIPFRLAATATPAPNDHMELGQHSQFLGAMDSSEMLSRWFIADQRNMGRYRLKRHGVAPFWNWVASWARALSRPSDLGYSDDGFVLPPMELHRHLVRSEISLGEVNGQATMMSMGSGSATSIHHDKRRTAAARAAVIAELVASEPTEPWIVWCDTDYEADELTRRIPGAVEVRGSMPAFGPDGKEARLEAFTTGAVRVLVTKPSIAGFGLNWQHCARMAFIGLSYSYEAFYQAVRRCWRFGQTRPVDVHVALADTDMPIWHTVSRKADDHDTMKDEMRAAMRRAHESRMVKIDYCPELPAALPRWLSGAAA